MTELSSLGRQAGLDRRRRRQRRGGRAVQGGGGRGAVGDVRVGCGGVSVRRCGARDQLNEGEKRLCYISNDARVQMMESDQMMLEHSFCHCPAQHRQPPAVCECEWCVRCEKLRWFIVATHGLHFPTCKLNALSTDWGTLRQLLRPRLFRAVVERSVRTASCLAVQLRSVQCNAGSDATNAVSEIAMLAVERGHP